MPDTHSPDASLRALVISPFSVTPADAGHRRRTLQSVEYLRRTFGEVTFLLYAFEKPWYFGYQADYAADIKKHVDEFVFFPGRKDIGAPPQDGKLHHLDEWVDERFYNYLESMSGARHFDAVIVHNVWMSKYLDCFPHSLRLIETHDIFSHRLAAFRDSGAAPEFFYTSEKHESFGLNRSDISIAIQDTDRAWIAENSSCQALTVPYLFPGEAQVAGGTGDYRDPDKVTFGFVGSSHAFNVSGMRDLIDALVEVTGETFAPVELRVAGTIGDRFPPRIGQLVEFVGYVDDEDLFVDEVDFLIAPLFNGTGFKVKVADAVARGKPIIASEHAAHGLALDERSVAGTAGEMAELMAEIALMRPKLADYARIAAESHAELESRTRLGEEVLRTASLDRVIALVIDATALDHAAQLLETRGFYRSLASQLRPGFRYVKVFLRLSSPLATGFFRRADPAVTCLAPGEAPVGFDRIEIALGTEASFTARVFNRGEPDASETVAFDATRPDWRYRFFFQSFNGGEPEDHAMLAAIRPRDRSGAIRNVMLTSGARASALPAGAGDAAVLDESELDATAIARLAHAFATGETYSIVRLDPLPNPRLEIFYALGQASGGVFVEPSRGDDAVVARNYYDRHAAFWRDVSAEILGLARGILNRAQRARNAALNIDFGLTERIRCDFRETRYISVIDIEESFDGFHELELFSEDHGQRWISGVTPVEFRLIGAVPGDSLVLAGVFMPALSEPELEVTCDGREVMASAREQDGALQITVPLDGCEMIDGAVSVTVTFPDGAVPARHDPNSDDQRCLSFALMGLSLQAASAA